jgi:hypothetical protein
MQMKPYVKLAYTLILFGMAIFAFERFGLSQMGGGQPIHLAGWIISVLVVAPVILVISGCIVWMFGRMRRL